jgi:cell fate regulator YaaT (PSP1 superfamily)
MSTPIELKARDRVITKTQHGSEVATVLRILPDGKTADLGAEPFIKDLVRVVTPEDRDTLADLARKEAEAFQRTKDLVAQHKLDMKLLKAEYLFDFSRLILYYKAENKVDFRELLKSLAGTFKTRIELRQIGVRDETKLLGGIGCCGKPVCCAQFMSDFHPVSTKMAKDQNLSMNPAKLSGMCCRLLCCIAHEHEYYASFHGKFPKIGAEIVADKEKGKVMDINFVTQKAFIVFWDRRRKLNVSLSEIKGRKDPGTGRNLWWIQEPGKPEPDLSILLQPPPQPAVPGRDKDVPDKPGRRPSRPDGKDSSSRNPRPGPAREGGTPPAPAAPVEAPREPLPPRSDTPDGKNENP